MALSVFVACSSAGSGDTVAGGLPLCPSTFEPGTDCRWKPVCSPGLRMNAHYIAGPAPGQDRSTWIEALRRYRETVRDGRLGQIIDLDYHGVRAWVRLAPSVARAYDLKPGDKLHVAAEARSLSGNGVLCVAFDVHDRADGAKTGWSRVRATLRVPTDKEWHRAETTVEVPILDTARQWLRPIIGMDATHDVAPGHLEIRSIQLRLGDAERMAAVERAVAALPNVGGALDRSLYDRADLGWAAGAVTCHFTFMYDRSLYDPQAGRYTLDALLDDGEREFGGYDLIVLWQAYPRLGVDERNQFDMYRDMPGGLRGIRNLVRRAHDRGVRVFIDYNPWDRGTRRDGQPDEAVLAAMIAEIEADGIFLDTMSASSVELRRRVDRARAGVVLAPEGHPNLDQLSMLSASWAQWLRDPHPPGLLHLKWIEPRHMQHQIHRWDHNHQGEIETAFFNGSGILVWENVFGTYNPWPVGDRVLWRRAAAILRHFQANFTSDAWDPFIPTCVKDVYAHRWPGDGTTVYTLLNQGPPVEHADLLELPVSPGAEYYDLWNGRPIEPRSVGEGKLRLRGGIDRLGCLLVVDPGKVGRPLRELLERQRRIADAAVCPVERRNGAACVMHPAPVAPTKQVPRGRCPAGMVFVPGATVRMKIEHQRRECGCYPDPGTPPEKARAYLWGHPFSAMLRHDYTVKVGPFFIDQAEVSNADYKRFLDASGYRPSHRHNFLKHWPGGEMPEGLADRPVVYVALDDARAYARWAGKRLPTEPEWHLAAQGADGCKWPWGQEFEASRCSSEGKGTMPVRSCPTGRSPYGCYHMSGNVWEWTESVRDDGHTRFAILRGGSYFNAEGSVWYVRGGPQPCDHHAKFLLMWAGLDRCATIGFRCVVDVK